MEKKLGFFCKRKLDFRELVHGGMKNYFSNRNALTNGKITWYGMGPGYRNRNFKT